MIVPYCVAPPAFAGDAKDPSSFFKAKTVFQTALSYDPRIAIAVDAVIVHKHGCSATELKAAVGSWREKGFPVGRMFFSDSDATSAYSSGKWDGKPHPDDLEVDSTGQVVKCAGLRPYVTPTEGWINYLEDMAKMSLEAGVDAILPEEPLAHVFSGYEKSFQKLWVQHYNRPWQPENSSHEARFLTAQLKNELYIKLLQRLLRLTKKFAADHKKDISFVIPVHSLYSNISAELVAPLATSTRIGPIDGYIGQIWTGPVNWPLLLCYDSPRESFFTSAYALYDYFAQIAVGTDKKLWLLVDPVEDDPNHKWSE